MTGIQWAVLQAYAASLPADSEGRRLVEEVIRQEKPKASGQRVAWVVAESCGMVEGGKITAKGKQAAQTFMSVVVARRARGL